MIENCGISVGNVVVSTAGRDKNLYFIVVKVEDNYVYLVDGDVRKIENPKKKKIKHVEMTRLFDAEIAERLVKNNKLSNHEIKKCLKNLMNI